MQKKAGSITIGCLLVISRFRCTDIKANGLPAPDTNLTPWEHIETFRAIRFTVSAPCRAKVSIFRLRQTQLVGISVGTALKAPPRRSHFSLSDFRFKVETPRVK